MRVSSLIYVHVCGRFGQGALKRFCDLEFDRKADAAGANTCIILSIDYGSRRGRVRDATGFNRIMLMILHERWLFWMLLYTNIILGRLTLD